MARLEAARRMRLLIPRQSRYGSRALWSACLLLRWRRSGLPGGSFGALSRVDDRFRQTGLLHLRCGRAFLRNLSVVHVLFDGRLSLLGETFHTSRSEVVGIDLLRLAGGRRRKEHRETE